MQILFPDCFEWEPIEAKIYNFADLFAAVRHRYPEYNRLIHKYLQNGYDFNLFEFADNGEMFEISIDRLTNQDIFAEIPVVKIDMFPVGSGTVGKIGLGIAMVGLGLSGVGLLGLSATTLALTGGSLLFSALFKHPSPKNKADKNNQKSSVNFSGVVNVTGGGNLAPSVFGEVCIGSIVASASIVPYNA